jgi:thioesterase domain-containing protein/aryl carrier-like protein
MVPSAFVFLESMPLTANGKIDRRALPIPENPKRAITFEDSPRNKLEFELSHVWKQLLFVNHVAPRDNFFDLGGDSLLAVRLLERVRKRFGKSVPLVDFFVSPSLEHLAELLHANGCSSQWSSLFPIQSRGSKPPFFWVHGDASNFLLPAYLGQDQPCYGFMHQCQDGGPARYTTVEEIAMHYLEELRSVQPEGPYFLGGYSFGGLVAFEMAQQLRTRGEIVTLLALLEATVPGRGTPDSSEQSQPINAAQESANASVSLHGDLANPRFLSAVEPIVYAATRIRRLAGQASRFVAVRRAATSAIRKFCERTGRTMPPSVRMAYLMNIYNEAARRYNPSVYPARVMFIKSLRNAHDHLGRWTTLVTAGLEVHRVGGDHASIIKEPQLGMWAEKLKDCLDRAHLDVSRGK